MEHPQIRQLLADAARVDATWWKDERRYWCAYCGIPTRRKRPSDGSQPMTLRTRDHVIPKAHRGGRLTIPACRQCNLAKGTMSLPEYLKSDHFEACRRSKHRNQWSLQELWAVAGIAALKCSAQHSTTPPAGKQTILASTTSTADHTR